MTTSKKALKPFKNKHVMFVLRASAKIPSMTSQGLVQSNAFAGWLVDFDDEYLYVGDNSSKKDYQTILRRTDVVAISLTPDEDEMMLMSMMSGGGIGTEDLN